MSLAMGKDLPQTRSPSFLTFDDLIFRWRLALLEKLELVTGKYVTICVAEEILSIGEGQSVSSAPHQRIEPSQVYSHESLEQ